MTTKYSNLLETHNKYLLLWKNHALCFMSLFIKKEWIDKYTDKDYRLIEEAFIDGYPNLSKDDLKDGWTPLAIDAHHWALNYVRCPKEVRENVLANSYMTKESVDYLKDNNLWIKFIENERHNLSKNLDELL